MKKIIYILLLCLLPLNVYAADYVIGDGDSLQISVWGSPELSLEVTVRPDGKISLPAQGDIEASGLTPNELKEALEDKLSNIVKSPIVTVIVTKMTNYQLTVFGSGTTPGIHELQRETTLLQFLSKLGAMENADLKNAYLMRDKKILKKGFYALFRNGDLSEDVVLEPDDILFIPDNFNNRISIVGEVIKPSTIPYKEGLTVLDVILSADGFTEFAKQNDVMILRKKEEGREEVEVRAKDLLKGSINENVAIEPGDIVIVKEKIF